ncbi:FAD-dependent monooxygenase [bacterium]|nr:FAD-dependent monooxygenase [bacterium]
MAERVLIAGAGPVGLSLALGLSHHGIPSIVLEEDEGLSTQSKALGCHARTLEIFRAWGVRDRFLTAGIFLSRIAIWTPDSPEPQATLDLSSLSALTADPGILILPQDRTEALLLARLKELGLAEVRFGAKLTAFTQDASGVIATVVPKEGTSYDLTGDYLLGCDGPHSTVRERLGWHLVGKTYPSRLMLADFHLPDARNDQPWPRFAALDGGLGAAIHFEPGRWRLIGILAPDETEEEAISKAGVQRRIEALFGPGEVEVVWASAFHIHCRTSPHFRLGRVLLAGDAAHINSPAGGQGMNSGIMDAHNLAWKLARALHGGDTEALLTSYEAERRQEVLSVVDRYTDRLTRLLLLPGAATRARIARALRVLIGMPSIVRRLAPKAAMLDVRYEASPLISGEGPWLGARAPDGELIDRQGQSIRLLDLVSREATLLLFEDGRLPSWDRTAIASLCADVPGLKVVRIVAGTCEAAPGDYRDATGTLFRAWRATGGDAALVRPDGHVGWRERHPTPTGLAAGVRRALGAPGPSGLTVQFAPRETGTPRLW